MEHQSDSRETGKPVDLVQTRSIEPLKVALQDAGSSVSDINDVIPRWRSDLHTPMVQKKVAEFWQRAA